MKHQSATNAKTNKLRTLLIAFLIFSLIAPMQQALADSAKTNARFNLELSFASLYNTVKALLAPTAPVQSNEDPALRSLAVTSFQSCPSTLKLYKGEVYIFAPMPLDSKGNPVHGAAFSYSSSNPSIASIASNGVITGLDIGQCTITATSGLSSSNLTVEILSGSRPQLTDAQWNLEHAQDCGGPQNSPTLAEPDEPNENPNAANYSNATGNPRFTPSLASTTVAGGTNDQLGSSNYSFDVPIFSSSGRGVGVDLSLSYNSRVWAKDGNKMIFDYDRGWPAAGFRLNYGRIILNYDVAANLPGNHLLIEADGTRIPLIRQVGGDIFKSIDGQHLVLKRLTDGSGNYQLRYPGGTDVLYNIINNRLQPHKIEDINGNSIQIEYVSSCSSARRLPGQACDCSGSMCVRPSRQAIDRIKDTLGRYITFYYNNDGTLAEIRVPGYNNTADRTVAKFYYQPRTLTYNFGQLQVVNVPSGNSFQALRRVYFPDTGKGYVFEEYSGYGMCTKISTRAGMTEAAEGASVAYTEYQYLTTGTLSDAPQFDKRFTWWRDKTDSNGTPTNSPTTYTYSRTVNIGAKTVTNSVTGPNNIRTEVISDDDPQSAHRGLLIKQKQVNVSTNTALLVQEFEYSAPSSVSGRQRTSVKTTDDGTPTANESKVTSIYGDYGRLLETIEFGTPIGSAFRKRRRTVYEYLTDSAYTDKGLYHLVKDVKVYDAKETDTNNDDGSPIARTSYAYDCEDCQTSDPDYTDWILKTYGYTDNCSPTTNPPCTLVPGFDTKIVGRAVRGNITRVKLWSDATASSPQIVFRHQYDIFGNRVKSMTSCCSLQQFAFSSSMWYSRPISVTDGPTPGPSLQHSYMYDFETGFLKEEKDPNNLTTSYTPDSAMRTSLVTFPKLLSDSNPNPTLETNFLADAAFGNQEGLVYQTKFTYKDGPTQKVNTTKQVLNGAGQVIRTQSAAGATPTSFDTTSTMYDEAGRVLKVSNPYTSDAAGVTTDTLYWTVYAYDALGRVTQTTFPDTTNKIEVFYNGLKTTATDQVGRQRQSEVDGLGRLIRVTEMDDSANKALTWHTTYSYDLNNNLTLINQGGQTRAYKYDSLSRLIYERSPEQNATIDDGSGTMWSGKYEYTEFNAVARHTDARRVVTKFLYDELNRLYNTSYELPSPNPDNVEATPEVTITYGTAVPDKGRVKTIDDALGAETFSYDGLSRVQSRTRTIGSRSYVTSYQYNQANDLKKLTYPSSRFVDVGYDLRGRLSSLGGTRSYLTSISYKPSQQVQSIELANGLTESFGYSADTLQLTSQNLKRGQSTPIMNISYGYSATAADSGGTRAGNSGQLMSVTASINGQGRNQTFKYDQVGRLSQASGSGTAGAWQRRYSYDRWGNRTRVESFESGYQGNPGPVWCTKQLAQYDVSNGVALTNRATSIATVSGCDAAVAYSTEYDRAGNVMSDSHYDYTYDTEGRMVKSALAGTGNQTSYSYDYANRRAIKQTTTSNVHYIWEGSQIIAEHDATTGATLKEYIYAGSRLVAQDSGGQVRYFHQDKLSTRMITNSAGNAVGSMSNLPFGEQLQEAGEQSKQRFTSYERDSETDSDYAMNRQYSQNTGRFMQPDLFGGSILSPQSLNRYAYVQNDPINLTDPLGLYPEPVPGQPGCTWDPETATLHCRVEDWLDEPPNPLDPYIYPPVVVRTTKDKTGKPRRQLDPNSRECQDLATKIANIRRDIEEARFNIKNNPLNLPETVPSGSPRQSVQGHRNILKGFEENLDKRLDEYRGKCGGGDPPDVPVRQPDVVPAKGRDNSTQEKSIITPGKVGAAVGVGVGGYLVYRGVRMLPSLAPPLWWTIPANAAIP